MIGESVDCRFCGEANPAGKRFCGECGSRLPVTCAVCGTENPSSHRFCMECGTALPGWCPVCGAEIFGRKRFCPCCGSALTEAPAAQPAATAMTRKKTARAGAAAATREERRLVTALFCDLVGFTPLSERLDAEQVREVQTAYFERMSREIARFGGTVEKFAGDAVLALFGVPVAHEDDAERAIRCALSMRAALVSLASEVGRRHGIELALRVGLNTGQAVSGMLDAGGRKDYAVTGDVVNTAARLQTAAEPGGIMAGAETMRLSERSVEFGEPQRLTLKGKSSTVVAYPVRGLRDRQVERWETRRQRTPLVGRDRELETILRAWDRVRDGKGQLVMLVADAGVGKSRLLAEAVERVALTGEVRELRGRCLSYGQDVSLWLVADLLRVLIGTRSDDEPGRVQTQIDTTVASLLASQDDETQTAAVDVLGEVLGLPIGTSVVAKSGAQARRQILVKSLRLLLSALAQTAPVVLVLEDLHWIDAASSEVLAEALADVQSLSVLVLAAQRPGWIAPWAEWSWIERLALQPLDDHDAVALAGAVLGDKVLSPELERYVAERAGGNPFFVEELLQALQETGGLAAQDGHMHLVASAAELLPPTLTEILLARLDRLDAPVRTLVQMASVIGRSFSVDLLARLAGREATDLEAALSMLPKAEIAFPRMGRQSEYVFKHATIRDVAYNTLLLKRRQELHAAVGRAMAGLGSTDESAEIIAYHFSQTEEHEEAAFWLERAGDRSADMYANQTAIGNYEEARKRLSLSGAEELVIAGVSEKLGGVFRIVAWYDEALEELESALETYRSEGDLEGEARTVAHIGQVHLLRGAREEGVRVIRETLARLEDRTGGAPLSRGLAVLYVALVDLLYNGQSFTEALVAADRAAELAQALHDGCLEVQADVRRGLALEGIGQLPQARQVLEDTMPRAETAGDLESFAKALIWTGDIHLMQGRPNEARAYFERALRVDENRGDLAETAYLLGRLGQALFVLGNWAEARAHFERTVEIVRSISFAYFSAQSMITLGRHYLLEGERGKAQRYLEEPFTIAERSGQLELIPYLHVPLAGWDVFEGHAEAALTRLQPLLETPRFNTAVDHNAMQVAVEAYLRTGSEADVDEILRQGLDAATAQDNQLARLGWLRAQGLVAAAREDEERANRSFAEAVSLARSMPYPYEEARALTSWGLMRVRNNQPQQGREQLEEALHLFQTLGAGPNAQRVEQAIADLVAAEA